MQMQNPPSDHAPAHNPWLTLALSAVLVLVAVASSAFHGNDISLIALKALLSIPFAIGFVLVPRAFDPSSARAPINAAFLERNLCLGTFLVSWVTMVLWAPGQHPAASIIAVIFGVAAYVFAQAMIALAGRGQASRQ